MRPLYWASSLLQAWVYLTARGAMESRASRVSKRSWSGEPVSSHGAFRCCPFPGREREADDETHSLAPTESRT